MRLKFLFLRFIHGWQRIFKYQKFCQSPILLKQFTDISTSQNVFGSGWGPRPGPGPVPGTTTDPGTNTGPGTNICPITTTGPGTGDYSNNITVMNSLPAGIFN